MVADSFCFEQLHIEVARNATDDFNPFHDKNRWQNVVDNPFGGPIVLGFQLECLLEQQVRLYRAEHDEQAIIEAERLRYSNYDFKFVNAVRAGQSVEVAIKESRLTKADNLTLGNRVSLLADGRLVIAGHKRESRVPITRAAIDLTELGDLTTAADRSYISGSDLFLKRKYITTSNAKNFLSASLVEQSDYIDEIAERVRFPEIFPCAWISCALLERASQQGHDFERNPLVYMSHSISLDRTVLEQLKSNDSLHLLCRPVAPDGIAQVYECFGVLGADQLLFSALITLMPLAASP